MKYPQNSMKKIITFGIVLEYLIFDISNFYTLSFSNSLSSIIVIVFLFFFLVVS